MVLHTTIASIVLLIGSASSLSLGLAPARRSATHRIVMQTDEVPGDVEDIEPAAIAPVFESEFESDDKEDGSIAKQALMAEMSGGMGGPKPDKAAIGEILLALEARNPTPSPATSALLNGKWKVLYATGASPGLQALTLLLKGAQQAPKSPSGAELIDVQDTFITIQAEQPRVEAATKVRVLSFESTAKLLCRLEAESAVRLLETYDAAETDGFPVKLPALPFQSGPLQYKRTIIATYLDEEVLVLRDSAGRPDVLMRCSEPAADPAPATAEQLDDLITSEEEITVSGDAPSD